MFRNTVNYEGRVRDFHYSFVYKFANVDYTCVVDAYFSKNICFFSQAPPRYREQACTLGRVFYHMEIRTLNARGMFREKYRKQLTYRPLGGISGVVYKNRVFQIPGFDKKVVSWAWEEFVQSIASN